MPHMSAVIVLLHRLRKIDYMNRCLYRGSYWSKLLFLRASVSEFVVHLQCTTLRGICFNIHYLIASFCPPLYSEKDVSITLFVFSTPFICVSSFDGI